LPFDVQLDLVRSIKGLENAHILRPGYAIEYDYFDPRGLKKFTGDQGNTGVVFSPGKSTEQPATKKPPRKVCWRG